MHDTLFCGDDCVLKQAKAQYTRSKKDFIATRIQERRELLWDRKGHEFLKIMEPKWRVGAGNKPTLYRDSDKAAREPCSAEEWMAAADQDHAETIGGVSKWELPVVR